MWLDKKNGHTDRDRPKCDRRSNKCCELFVDFIIVAVAVAISEDCCSVHSALLALTEQHGLPHVRSVRPARVVLQ